MINTYLVLLGDNYSADQKGYNEALKDGSVHNVNIDEQSYTSMYNVQQAIQATCNCTGSNVSLGLERDNVYLPFSIIEVGENDDEYQDLNEAYDKGMARHLAALRSAVDSALDDLAEALGECEERKTIDHCTDCIEQQRK
jgi:hypothetical protein